MEYRVLGPWEVLEDGRPLALGNLKERMVLAVLLLHANELVPRERLIDEIWGPAPPPTARKAVNVYVSKLRKTLSTNAHDLIATADGGYRLVVAPDRLDADRARSLITEARDHVAAGDAAAPSGLLQETLALWRGPTLAGLSLESFARCREAPASSHRPLRRRPRQRDSDGQATCEPPSRQANVVSPPCKPPLTVAEL